MVGETITLKKNGKLWANLDVAAKAVGGKVQNQGGELVLCVGEQCALMSEEVLRVEDGTKYVDYFWARDAFGGGAGTQSVSADVSGAIRLPDLDCKSRTLSEFCGRKTVFYLWSSW